jgi:hypothetical protein
VAVQYCISTGAATMVAATAKTLIEIPSASTMPFVVYKMEATSGATAAGGLTLSWCTYTVTGTGTTYTPLKWGVDQSVAAVLLIPLPGMYSIIDPFGRETYQPISVLRCLRATSSLPSPVAINLYIEQ